MSLSTATTSATSALLVPYPETSSSATSTSASNNDRQTAVRVRAFSPPSAASSASCLQQRAHSFCINNQRLLQQQRRPGGVPDELQPLNRRSTMATTSAARTSKSLSPSSPSPHHHWWWPVGSALVGGTGGLMTILQRALCNMNHRGEGQYQTVLLTRESADSGLELDRLENGGGLCSAKAEEEEDLNDDEEEEEVEDDDAEDDRRTEEETTATTSRRMMMTETKNRKSPQPPPRLSLGRLLSSFSSFGVSSTQNSANNTNNASNSSSADSHSMFDFPSASPLLMGPLEPPGYAQSPIAQLSHSNAVLMAENQRLANQVQELEHSLRDHVAHLNSVYFTLYQRHGFDALQLPDGEMVQLTQFKGPEVVLLTFVRSPSLPAGVDADGSSPATQQQLAERRHRLQQQIRQQKQAPNSGGQPAQASESSPSSVGSGSASSFQLLGSVSTDSSLDPVEMFHQLCIRPATAGKGGGAEMAEEDRQQIQAYVDWLKCEGATEEANQEAHRLMARLRAQQVQAQVKLANGNGSAAGTPNNKWMAAASSPNGGGNSGGRVHFNMEERRKSGSFGGGGSGDSVSSTTRAGQEQQQTRKSQLLLDGWRNEVAGGNGSELLAARGSVDGCLLLMAAESGNGGANASSRTPSPRSAFGGATKGQQRMRSPSAAYLQTRRMSSSATGAIMSGNHIGGNEERSPRRGGGIGLVSACRNTMRVEHRVAKRNLI